MIAKRKVTVSTSIRFEGMQMESTDAALDIIRGVMVTMGKNCQEEIKRALEEAGAKDVSISMAAY